MELEEISEQEQFSTVASQEESRDFSNSEEESGEPDEAALESSAIRLPLTARVCSVLFVANKPLSVEDLAEVVGVQVPSIERVMEEVANLFSEDVHGFSLHTVAGAFQLRTSPGAAACIQRLIPKHARRLSRAAAETLAVIAYKQPVQRAEIETIRGVDVLGTLKTLLDAKLVRIVGRASSPGHPALYGTTQTFLEKFGLNDLSQLPTPREINQFLREPGEEGEDSEGADELLSEVDLGGVVAEQGESSSQELSSQSSGPS